MKMTYKVAAMVFYILVFSCLATVAVAARDTFYQTMYHMQVHVNITEIHIKVIDLLL